MLARWGEKKTTFRGCPRAVKVVPRDLITKLGKRRAMLAARLIATGRWTPEWADRLMALDTEQAAYEVCKACGEAGEEITRTWRERMTATQWQQWEETWKRLKKLTGEPVDFIVAHFAALGDEQIKAEVKGNGDGKPAHAQEKT